MASEEWYECVCGVMSF